MKKRIGILTSGGDCPGLNAAIRGVARAAYTMFDADIIGIRGGYLGLIEGDFQEMNRSQFSNILTMGGTILGTSRTPFRDMRVVGEDQVDKVEQMKNNYAKMGLDCLVTLGGNGTHKTANMLSMEGLNIIGLPKTIDNDIYGTDFTFGFHTAVEIATDVIDRVHTTAASHSRVMVIELMGNKTGWLTLYAGIAGGADAILLPELPYDIREVAKVIERRASVGKNFTIIAVAEGAMDVKEAKMKRKQRDVKRAEEGCTNVSIRIAGQLEQMLNVVSRTVIPGHVQRGGTPCAYDRVLSTQFGVHAAQLISNGTYGVTVALKGERIVHNSLSDIAGVAKPVTANHHMVKTAKSMGISLGVAGD
ncbi:MAG: ATP-dependent 6-phosphofructokinase [Eubacteriales bacterium]|jgi:6-phosphofructokinase 1|nr:ATP-dependent 6-phosphofructokinase [Eubacteriales bacterium]MDD4104396.1 ATP-dependent 6-phosphofructokinase [Eubacteriales bacterium]MDD4709657.1 ATP-dependent 6-phosphofructokinase [Eubacteriales bacterium]NLO15712.1 6-phosphofructokinase [Clostridiales bacterium]